MLELAHEGHPGESVMKRRLRDRVWWPGMDREIEKNVSSCEGCRLVCVPNRPEPMERRPLPNGPWIDIALDFMGPLPSGEYLLVVIDYYSRYKEVEIMKHITAEDTINRLRKIFTRLGYPVTITLDNAKQFLSNTFENYCTQNKIHLNYSTPYWPQENGLVERQNRSLLKRLQISHALGRNWKHDLEDYLLMYYTTPHSVTKKTPTELCYGRTIRSKIPCLTDLGTGIADDEVQERDKRSKLIGKEKEDKRRGARVSEIQVGDTVLMKNLLPGNKLTSNFGPSPFVVSRKIGSRVEIKNKSTGKVFERNSSHLKRVVDSEVVSSNDSTPEDSLSRFSIIPPTVVANEEEDTDNSPHFRSRRNVKPPSRFQDYVVGVLDSNQSD
ncbi:uncharacterized protein K02A2.6-like [Uranotaenia lowii]|nr:uncharacterized protein K02A2.6-like [Uranotaenia lowii]